MKRFMEAGLVVYVVILAVATAAMCLACIGRAAGVAFGLY